MVMMQMQMEWDFFGSAVGFEKGKNITSCFPVSYNATKAGDDKMMIAMMMMMMTLVRRRWRRNRKMQLVI